MRGDPLHCDVAVFDVDDTLFLERDYVASGFAALDPYVADTFGVCGFRDAAWRRFLAGGRGRIFDDTLAELGAAVAAADIAELVVRYRRHQPCISLLPDAARAVRRLRSRGVRLALLTDGPAESQAAKVTALGLAAYAECIVLTAEFGAGYGKPHERGFRHIAEATGARAPAYIADNPAKDFVAPSRLGWTTVRVRRPRGLHAEEPGGPDIDVTIGDLDALPRALAPARPSRQDAVDAVDAVEDVDRQRKGRT